MLTSGRLITFEGVGGSGKSTVAARVADWFGDRGQQTILLKEPGATEVGASLRTILVDSNNPLAPWTEAFLFEADRAETYARLVSPALESGCNVVFDRGPYGTFAYQGHGRQLDLVLIDAMSAAATLGLRPDVAIVIDVPVEVGLARKRTQGQFDRFDDEPDIAFHERVRAGYLSAAARDGHGAVIVDGSRDLETVVLDVLRILESRRIGATEQDRERG